MACARREASMMPNSQQKPMDMPKNGSRPGTASLDTPVISAMKMTPTVMAWR